MPGGKMPERNLKHQHSVALHLTVDEVAGDVAKLSGRVAEVKGSVDSPAYKILYEASGDQVDVQAESKVAEASIQKTLKGMMKMTMKLSVDTAGKTRSLTINGGAPANDLLDGFVTKKDFEAVLKPHFLTPLPGKEKSWKTKKTISFGAILLSGTAAYSAEDPAAEIKATAQYHPDTSGLLQRLEPAIQAIGKPQGKATVEGNVQEETTIKFNTADGCLTSAETALEGITLKRKVSVDPSKMGGAPPGGMPGGMGAMIATLEVAWSAKLTTTVKGSDQGTSE
jgi:hypothetical protein